MSEGRRGSAPDWYTDLIVAEKLGVSVVDLEHIPFYWRERALLALDAENYATREQMAHNSAAVRNRSN